jgi:hypothetical protein
MSNNKHYKKYQLLNNNLYSKVESYNSQHSQIYLTSANYILLLTHYFINHLCISTSEEKIFYNLKMNFQYRLFILLSEIQ